MFWQFSVFIYFSRINLVRAKFFFLKLATPNWVEAQLSRPGPRAALSDLETARRRRPTRSLDGTPPPRRLAPSSKQTSLLLNTPPPTPPSTTQPRCQPRPQRRCHRLCRAAALPPPPPSHPVATARLAGASLEVTPPLPPPVFLKEN